MPLSALALLLALTPALEDRLWLWVDEVPVGQIALLRDPDGGYRYVSTHLFTRGSGRERRTRRAAYALDAEGRAGGAYPASLWVLRRPGKLGCVPGLDELSGERGPLCVTRREGALDRGTLLGRSYLARYSGGGRLVRLEVAGALFLRAPKGPLPWPPDLFGRGFPVEGGEGALALTPPRAPSLRSSAPGVAGLRARRLAEAVRAEVAAEEGACLKHARLLVERLAAAGLGGVVVLGLVTEPGGDRAYPHAWVRLTGSAGPPAELDPSREQAVTPGTHLPLGLSGEEAAGARYLELLEGRRHLLRERATARGAGG